MSQLPADAQAASPFAALGRRLFAQLQAAGRLSAPAGIPFERLYAEVLPRALIAGVVADVTGWRPAPAGVTIYNGVDWPAQVAPAGKLCDLDISMWQHITSLVTAWTTQGSDPPVFARRVARAFLWIARAEGFVPAVAFHMDLLRDGLLIHPEVAVEAVRPLLVARRMATDDLAAANLFLDVSIDAPQAWIRQPFKTFEESSVFVRDDLDDDLEYILDRVESEIELVRAATSYDEWFVGQALLYHFTRFALHLFERLGFSEALPFQARLARFEEVRADAGSFMTNARALSKMAFWQYAAVYTSAITYTAFQAVPDEETVRRVVEQRAVIPNALLERFWRNERNPETCSAPWRGFSSTIAPIVGRALFGDARLWIRRRKPPTAEQVGVLSESVDLFHSMDPGDSDARAAFLALCSSPRDASIRGRLRAKGLADARIDDVLDTVLQRCSDLEMRTMLQIADDRAQTDRTAGAAVARVLADNYPWYADAFERLAAYGGLEHDGVGAAIEAIVLETGSVSHWETLAAALRAAGDAHAAETAALLAKRVTALSEHVTAT